MTASAAFNLDQNGGQQEMTRAPQDDSLGELFEEKSAVQRVIIFDQWLMVHGFQKATSMDRELGVLVQTGTPFFYFKWLKKKPARSYHPQQPDPALDPLPRKRLPRHRPDRTGQNRCLRDLLH
jgi:hypothetical protein